MSGWGCFGRRGWALGNYLCCPVSLILFFGSPVLKPNLYTSRGHIELLGEFLSQSCVGLGVRLEHGLEDFELSGGCPLAVLDLVGDVGIKVTKAEVVHALQVCVGGRGRR